MGNGINLADPDFEPTDAQLVSLSTAAFAGVRAAREAAMAKLRAQIAEAQNAALDATEKRLAAGRRPR